MGSRIAARFGLSTTITVVDKAYDKVYDKDSEDDGRIRRLLPITLEADSRETRC